jgi:hypothetical protein
MAGLQFDLTAPDVWEHVYDESKTAEQPTPQTFISIPRITIPVLLHERVFRNAVSAAGDS